MRACGVSTHEMLEGDMIMPADMGNNTAEQMRVSREAQVADNQSHAGKVLLHSSLVLQQRYLAMYKCAGKSNTLILVIL